MKSSIRIGQGKISHMKVVKADAKKLLKNKGSALSYMKWSPEVM